jgi:hypothetical protein
LEGGDLAIIGKLTERATVTSVRAQLTGQIGRRAPVPPPLGQAD